MPWEFLRGHPYRSQVLSTSCCESGELACFHLQLWEKLQEGQGYGIKRWHAVHMPAVCSA